eukprot:6663790-Alexandrium_andersonii.AAC.1
MRCCTLWRCVQQRCHPSRRSMLAITRATAALANGSKLLSTLSNVGIETGAAAMQVLCRASTANSAALPKSLPERSQITQTTATPKEHCATPACEAASHASRLALMPLRLPPVE